MKDIKSKETKKDIKILDKSRVIAERMKNAAAQTKEKTERDVSANEDSPNEYASDRTGHVVGYVKDKAIYDFNKQGQKGLDETKQNISKARDYIRNRRNNGYSGSGTKNSVAKSTENPGSKQIRQTSRSAQKMTAKTVEKHTIKTTQQTVKTAEKTSKASIKTAQQSAKVVQKTAQETAKASQRAAQVARAAAKTTVTTLKIAAKATVAAVKAIIAGTKALVAAIAAGGWVAVVIIVVICLIALIVGSCFGIFFSNEDTGSNMTLQQVVREINEDYQSQLETIKANNDYDDLVITGSPATWPEVLSVYAVKTATDPYNPQEVATMTEEKKQILKELFWEMNSISHQVEVKTETILIQTYDSNGNIFEKEIQKTRTILYITNSHKIVGEMSEIYQFNDQQNIQLQELLNTNKSLWQKLLCNIDFSQLFD